MNGSATIFPRGSFALKLRKLPRATIDARVQEAAGLLGIGDLLARKPKQLSGGQRQRVALGRAIVRHPQVFLFDEPLSNLQGGSVSFRRDVESFLDADAIRAVPVPDRRELPPVAGVRSVAFVDPSGGSQDAFTLAIAHGDGGRAVLDVVREVRSPFSPDDVVADLAATLRTYRIAEVHGDRYAGKWPRERFRVHGVRYTPSERTKSDLYRELLPLVNAGRVELLDLPRLRAQLMGLERRTARGGKDSVDHAPGGHDDVANAAAGALVLASTAPRRYVGRTIPGGLEREPPSGWR